MATVALMSGLSVAGASAMGATGTALFTAGMTGLGAGLQMHGMKQQADFAQKQNDFAGAVEQNRLQKEKMAELDNFEQSQSAMRQFYSMMGVNTNTGSARLNQMGTNAKAERVFGDFRQRGRLARFSRSLNANSIDSKLKGQMIGKVFDTGLNLWKANGA